MASKPSNEEIIDNLTKDLNASRVSKDDDYQDDTSKSTDVFEHINSQEENDHDEPPSFSSQVDNESENDEDFIDENMLKDRETILTEEQKNDFHLEALNFKKEGNEQFKSGLYLESVISYSSGLRICPLSFPDDRSILYANRAASKHKLNRKESAIQDCSKAVDLNSNYLKAYLRRAVLHEETDKLDEAFSDYKKIMELDPNNREAVAACSRLPNQINEKNEKLKAEMIDKLKDLGNMVLRPFGLSTNNFKMTKDPNSGGYSVNFVQNP